MRHFEHVEAIVDTAAKSLPADDRPNWKPLELLLGRALLGQFMFMGRTTVGDVSVQMFKHGMTRRYLIVSDDLRTWSTSATPGPIGIGQALYHALEGAEGLGGAPGQAYDEGFKGRRDQALAAAGYKVMTIKQGAGVQI